MATAEDGLRAYLVAQTAITDLLSTTNSIRTDKEPQEGKRPFIRIELLDLDPDLSSVGANRFGESRILLHCEAKSRTVARNISEQIRLKIHGFQGIMGTVPIRVLIVNSIRDRDSGLFSGKEEGTPAVIMDISVLHLQPTS